MSVTSGTKTESGVGETIRVVIHAAGNLVAVLEAEIVTLDPHFSTAYISRTFGYMSPRGEIAQSP